MSIASTRAKDRVDIRSGCIGSHRFDRSMLGSMFRGTFGRHEIVRSIDQRDMSKGLREISQLAAKNGIVFFGEQADVVAHIQQTSEQVARLLSAAGQRIVIGEPEGARQEGSLTRWQAIDASL